MVHAESVPEALQRHWAFDGARMKSKETYRGQTYFLCEGGPHYDAKNSELEEGDEWMRDGYYVAAWGLQRGKAVIGFPVYFKKDHDSELSSQDREKARINSAKYIAKNAIDDMLRVGLLEEYAGSILLPN